MDKFHKMIDELENILKEKDKLKKEIIIDNFVDEYKNILKEIYYKDIKANDKLRIILDKKEILKGFLKNFKLKFFYFKHLSKQEIKETFELLKLLTIKDNKKNMKELIENKKKKKEQLKDLFLVTIMFSISAIPIPGSGFMIIYLNKLLKKLNIENISTLEEIHKTTEKIKKKLKEKIELENKIADKIYKKTKKERKNKIKFY